jgi:acetyl esterase/lipase
VPYVAIPGIHPLELDLYLPADASSPVPVVVFLHGGGWRVGSRTRSGRIRRCHAFTVRASGAVGLAVGSVGYRLSGEAAGRPTPRRQGGRALAAGPCRRGGHRCGPDGAWGESAGGHLAALLGLTGADMDGEIRLLGPPTEVETVVAWYAPPS